MLWIDEPYRVHSYITVFEPVGRQWDRKFKDALHQDKKMKPLRLSVWETEGYDLQM